MCDLSKKFSSSTLCSSERKQVIKLVFFSELPLLPLDDLLTATVVDSHYHSWSRVHQETSLLLLTSVQIVCPWQLLTVITKQVQHKHEVVINSLYKALLLSLIY